VTNQSKTVEELTEQVMQAAAGEPMKESISEQQDFIKEARLALRFMLLNGVAQQPQSGGNTNSSNSNNASAQNANGAAMTPDIKSLMTRLDKLEKKIGKPEKKKDE